MSFVAPGYPSLSYSQLEQVWISAGGSRAMAALMAAIALAESSGKAGNTNPTDNSGTQTSWGLWQISDGTHGWSYGGDPYDPVNNARVAIMKLKAQGLGAWGTYTSGAYKQYMQGNVPPDTGTIPIGTGGGGGARFGPGLGSTFPSAFPNPIDGIESLAGDVGGLAKDAFGWSKDLVKSVPDTYKAISKAVAVIADVFAGFLWFLNPSNDLRVLSGIAGLFVLAFAIYFVATA